MRAFLISLFVGLLISIFTTEIEAYYTNMSASYLLGQPSYDSRATNAGGISAHSFNRPYSIHSDGTHFLVTDFTNHRVLLWNKIPTSLNENADVVIGQPNFTASSSNQGGTRAANTIRYAGPTLIVGNKLLVSDFYNYRVLIFNSIPTSNNASANIVIGQPDFATGTDGCSSIKYKNPWGMEYDEASGKLLLADMTGNRVLIYNQIPTVTNTAADVVIGQPNMTTCTAGATSSKLQTPYSVRVFEGKMIVADTSNSRVLIWNSIPTTSSAAADIVLGQADFTSSSANQGGTVKANTMDNPTDIWYDGRHFFVFDALNGRILGYNGIPTSNNASADFVIGQPNFTSNSHNQGLSAPTSYTLSNFAGSLYNDGGIFGIGNSLYVADVNNQRVIRFDDVISSPTMGINAISDTSNGKKVTGTVQLGERNTYSLQWVKASVNGEGYTTIQKDGGRDDGSGKTLYEFSYEFEPWATVGKEKWLSDNSYGFTLGLKASSINADEKTLFYFEPFNLTEVSGLLNPKFKFSVNKHQWDRIKSNISSYEVEVKKDGESWGSYITGIPNDTNSNTNFVTTYDKSNGEISVYAKSKSIVKGKYQARIVAVDKSGNRQYSNTKDFESKGGGLAVRPNMKVTSEWFPLQINKISGVKAGILSNFGNWNESEFSSTTYTPTFKGISFNGSTINLVVSDTETNTQTSYTVKSLNSEWSLKPTIFKSSVIDMWVTDEAGHYSELPSFIINVNI